MLALLVVCCIIIYGMVMIFLPRNYHTELEGQVTSDFYDLVDILERNGWEASSDSLLEFSMTNNASVEISDDIGNSLFSVNYADMEKMDSSAPSMSCSATFLQNGRTYHLFANASLVAVSQSYDILLKLIPLIAAVILLISIIGAVICSRYYSKPLVGISNVAKRMTTLDMTWKCDVRRNDEIGVLASSLNEMSQQLSNALDSLQAVNEQLQQDIEREREQEKQRVDFFTSVSHELKTPIAIIQADTDVLTLETGEGNEWIDDIQHQVRRLSTLTNDLIYLSRMEEPQRQTAFLPLPFSDLVAETAQSFQAVAKSQGKTFSLRIQPTLTLVGEEKSLGQLVSILLDNALKYSPPGGEITVTLARQGKSLLLTVANTAQTLSKELLENMFDRFYRADSSRTGTGFGLGLAIARAIVQNHRGNIICRSQEGLNRFSVTLPVLRQKEAQ